MPYCTAQDVIDCCSWPGFGQLAASAQARFLAAASLKMDEVCRRKAFGFAQQSVTESFIGRNQPSLWLSLRPVASIASVTIDGEALDDTDGTAWGFDPVTGRLWQGDGKDDARFGRRWAQGTGNIAVAYTGGYAPIPDDLVLATAYTVRFFFDQGKISGAYSQETVGRHTYSIREQSLEAGLPGHIMGLLEGYVQDDAFA